MQLEIGTKVKIKTPDNMDAFKKDEIAYVVRQTNNPDNFYRSKFVYQICDIFDKDNWNKSQWCHYSELEIVPEL